jgi:DNA-binding NarL/FixJ family response regulator
MPDRLPTLVVADPHPVVREGLPLLLKHEDIAVVASAASGATVETLVERHDPDVVLLADRMPDVDGLSVLARLVRAGTRAAVVLYVEGEEGDRVPDALRAGAAGIVGSVRPVAQIARALRTVAAGGTWFNERDWVEAPLSAAAEQSVQRADGLSESERRVLALVAAGAATEEIGEALGVSPHTVRTHVRNLMRKLDAQSRAHAVAIAMREEAIDVEG